MYLEEHGCLLHISRNLYFNLIKTKFNIFKRNWCPTEMNFCLKWDFMLLKYLLNILLHVYIVCCS